VVDPQHFDEMRPNTILVCPMTSPAWTQLFAHATGLVTVAQGESVIWTDNDSNDSKLTMQTPKE
jgi:phosphoenolpyruvate synthase/pyruvate phosphate dikinase